MNVDTKIQTNAKWSFDEGLAFTHPSMNDLYRIGSVKPVNPLSQLVALTKETTPNNFLTFPTLQ